MRLWIAHHLDVLRQIARDVSYQVAKIVLMQSRLRCPKTNVLETSRILGVRLERSDLILRELGEESRIRGPEEANVRNSKEDHGNSFETETECPANVIRGPYAG